MRRLTGAGGIALLLLLLFALPASAAELSGGCSMELRSFDGPDPVTSTAVDQASASGLIPEGAVGSQTRPFKVDPEGSIDFAFHTGTTVFSNNNWSIFAQGLPVPILSGQDDNPMDVDETGVLRLVKLKALPFRVVGTFFVSGDLYGNGDTSHCRGEGYVQVLGDPIGTIPWDVAVALIVLSGLALLVATPYSTTWETDPNAGERLRTGPFDS